MEFGHIICMKKPGCPLSGGWLREAPGAAKFTVLSRNGKPAPRTPSLVPGPHGPARGQACCMARENKKAAKTPVFLIL